MSCLTHKQKLAFEFYQLFGKKSFLQVYKNYLPNAMLFNKLPWIYSLHWKKIVHNPNKNIG